jgi:hypothetical protein
VIFIMQEDNDAEILAAIQAAVQRSRGYADFFGWPPDRDLEEAGVLDSLVESMHSAHVSFYSTLKSRGRPNDPPDCEGLDANGARVAIEITELVDGATIQATKKTGRKCDFREWTKEDFLRELSLRIDAKDQRYPHLKEPPYPGGYVIVIHTDEPMLSRSAVQGYLEDSRFPKPKHVSRALLVLSYDPGIQRCPYFELAFNG